MACRGVASTISARFVAADGEAKSKHGVGKKPQAGTVMLKARAMQGEGEAKSRRGMLQSWRETAFAVVAGVPPLDVSAGPSQVESESDGVKAKSERDGVKVEMRARGRTA